jgi:copper ion binding protein
MSTSTYAVEGMTCNHCVAAVTEEVSKLPGVSSVTVDLVSGQVQVTSAEPLTREEVAAAVVEAGYELGS